MDETTSEEEDRERASKMILKIDGYHLDDYCTPINMIQFLNAITCAPKCNLNKTMPAIVVK